MSNTAFLTVKNVSKNFMVGEQELHILRDVSLEVEMGDFVVIFGPSGCGKSTLLHIMLGLEVPTSGEVVFFGENIYKLEGEDDRSAFRKKHLGMIYQQPNWIKSMNVSENVAFPLMLLGMDKELAVQKATEILAKVKMEKWAKYIPTELSGGQQQRVALVRALINNPEIIIADEPTGNLDFQAGQQVMELMANLNKQEGKTIIMVTHDLEYLRFAKRAIQMLDGQVVHSFYDGEIKELLKTLNFKRMQLPQLNKTAKTEAEETGETASPVSVTAESLETPVAEPTPATTSPPATKPKTKS